MTSIGIIIGSTRPMRVGESVGKWVYEQASKRTDAEYKLIDLMDYNLPLLDEPHPAGSGIYTKEHTKKWAAVIEPLDGFVFVTPEYNHSVNAALKNAIDFLYAEWKDKVVAYVGYGGTGAIRSIEHLRQIMLQFQVVSIYEQLGFKFYSDFENGSFKPAERHLKSLDSMISALVTRAELLKSFRNKDIAHQ